MNFRQGKNNTTKNLNHSFPAFSTKMKSLKNAKTERTKHKPPVSRISNNAIFMIKNELIYSLKCSNNVKKKKIKQNLTLKPFKTNRLIDSSFAYNMTS